MMIGWQRWAAGRKNVCYCMSLDLPPYASAADADGSPVLIALDWGTSSLRAYALDGQGQVLAQRQSKHGISQLPAPGKAGFEQALRALASDWLDDWPGTPWLACGMVGSAQGWCEAPYATVPIALDELSLGWATVELPNGRVMHIVPGLLEQGSLPNVMRGEETQLAGAMALDPACRDALIGLPGSHSKWAVLEQGRILHFDTYMTGEAYAALSQHTILARTLQRDQAFRVEAFLKGVEVAHSAAGRHGLLSNLFATRTLGLVGHLDGAEQADFLSGLLIGHEVSAVCATHVRSTAATVWRLVGDEQLCQRYQLALQSMGVSDARCLPQATSLGLFLIAQSAGLVARPAAPVF